MKSKIAVVCGCWLALTFAGCATDGTVAQSMPKSFSETFGQAELDKMPPPPPGVYDVTQVDKRPLPTKEVPPVYPYELRRQGITGEAVVVAIVDEKGVPDQIAIFRADEREFGMAAAACLAKWTFSPAILQGRPVRCRLSVPIIFALNN